MRYPLCLLGVNAVGDCRPGIATDGRFATSKHSWRLLVLTERRGAGVVDNFKVGGDARVRPVDLLA